MQLTDALISATIVANGLELLTGNARRYRVLKDISIKEFKPIHHENPLS